MESMFELEDFRGDSPRSFQKRKEEADDMSRVSAASCLLGGSFAESGFPAHRSFAPDELLTPLNARILPNPFSKGNP